MSLCAEFLSFRLFFLFLIARHSRYATEHCKKKEAESRQKTFVAQRNVLASAHFWCAPPPFFFFGVPLSFFCLFVFVSSSYCYFSATHIILSSIELFSSLFFRFSSSSAAHRIHIFPTPCFYLFWFAFAFFFLRFIFFKLSFYAATSKPESKWATAAKLFYTAILLRKSLRLFLSLFFLSFCVTFFFF